MSTKRTRGTTVRLIDNDKLGELAVAKLRVAHPDFDVTAARVHMSYALGESKSGQLFLICSEGVGWELDKPREIDFATSWRDEDGATHGTISATTPASFDADELRELRGRTIDLADFVRAFGARLEGNFWLWHDRLNSSTLSKR